MDTSNRVDQSIHHTHGQTCQGGSASALTQRQTDTHTQPAKNETALRERPAPTQVASHTTRQTQSQTDRQHADRKDISHGRDRERVS